MNLLMSLMSWPKYHAPVHVASLAWSFAIKKDYELKDSPEKKAHTRATLTLWKYKHGAYKYL